MDQETKTWKPFKRQEDFLSLPDSVFEGLYGGAAGGGKSEVLLLLPIVRGFYKHPAFKALILRRTYPELEREIILRSHEYYKPAGGSYNAEKKRWTFESRAVIEFGHSEYESDIRKYDTAQYNYIGWDEATSFTPFQYEYLSFSRCRSSIASLPKIVRAGTNPGNIGHGYFRARFIEPAPLGYTILTDKTTRTKRIFIPSKLFDNPHLMENDPEYQRRLLMLPEAERRAKLDGDWWTFSGQVFDDWREEPLSDEPSNARHTYNPNFVDIPSWWPRVLAIDWGYIASTIAQFGAISPTGRLYVYREYVAKRKKVSVWATEIAHLVEEDKRLGCHFHDVVMDPSAWQNRGEDRSIAEQFHQHSGINPRQAFNSRIAGKLLLQDYLRWRVRPTRVLEDKAYDEEYAARLLRNSGMEAYKDYLASFQPEEPETNLPKLQVSLACQDLRKTIPLCVYDETNKEDVAEFSGNETHGTVGDDSYDTIRYLIEAADRLINVSKRESDKRQDLGRILEQFEKTKDYNSFERRMDLYESKRKIGSQGVRRIHHASMA